MTRKQIAIWWIYPISGIVLFRFLAPSLISYPDTLLVLLGIVLMTLYFVWTYYLWVKPLFIKYIKEYL